jgi:hypothetical protein
MNPERDPELMRDFCEAKVVIERCHAAVGLPRHYLLRHYLADLRLLRKSSQRKRRLQRAERAQIAEFESWRHGELVRESA